MIVLKNIINNHLLLQNHFQHLLCAILRASMQGLAFLLYTLLNINQLTPSLSRQIETVWQNYFRYVDSY